MNRYLAAILFAVSCLTVCSCAMFFPTTTTGEGGIVVSASLSDASGEGLQADVYIDDVLSGTASLEQAKARYIYCENGIHIIKIVAEGYQPFEYKLWVRGTSPSAQVHAVLEPIPVAEEASEAPPETTPPADK